VTRLSDKTSELSARIAHMVLRVFPTDAGDALRWIVRSFGEEDEQDVFLGAGFAAQPAAGANAEAIAVAVNGYDHHVIVATRDADTLRRVVAAVGLEAGEAMVYSAATVLKCTEGKVLAQSLEGTPSPLARKSDVQEVWDYLAMQFDPATGHKHTVSGAATTVIAPSSTPSAISVGEPTGTQVLEGE
jgi:hypothetical protein